MGYFAAAMSCSFCASWLFCKGHILYGCLLGLISFIFCILLTESNKDDPTPTQEQIAKRAHQLWERKGRPHGYDNEIWLEAEKELTKKPKW